ncbi:MAG: HYR domain-containing protein, partial [Saprospiraceae bacterium]
MNRFFLLSLSVLAINLFGGLSLPKMLKAEGTATHFPIPNSAFSIPNSEFLADTVDPVITCPPSQTIVLPPNKCDAALAYSVTATDDQGTAIVIQLAGIPSGSPFPIGVNVCLFLATDLAGNSATCSFAITVQNGGGTMLTCSPAETVEMDPDCIRGIAAHEILEGGPYGCPTQYVVEVDKTVPFGNGPWTPALFNAADVGKTYQCRVTDPQTSNKCWGNVTLVDKIGPVLNCQDITVSCAETQFSPAFLKDSLGFATATPQVNDACGVVTSLTYTDTQVLYNCDTTFT